MANKFNQILVLSGLYFIFSSLFSLLSSNFNQLFAFIFPVFLILITILTFFRQLSWVTGLTKKDSGIVLLLNVLGAYVIVYFVINIMGAMLQYLNEQGLLTSIYAMYEEWGEPMNSVIVILFFVSFIVALFIILIRKFIKL